MGALTGLAVYVLSKGLGAFLGMTASTNGFGVAAVCFVAGFPTKSLSRNSEDRHSCLSPSEFRDRL
jgi:hypothetical protein